MTTARAGRLAGLDADACAEAIGALMAERIIEGNQALRLIHPLVRSAVYQDLASPVRQRWHLRAARLLDAEGGSQEDVTVHLLASAPAGDAWVAPSCATPRPMPAAAAPPTSPRSACSGCWPNHRQPPSGPRFFSALVSSKPCRHLSPRLNTSARHSLAPRTGRGVVRSHRRSASHWRWRGVSRTRWTCSPGRRPRPVTNAPGNRWRQRCSTRPGWTSVPARPPGRCWSGSKGGPHAARSSIRSCMPTWRSSLPRLVRTVTRRSGTPDRRSPRCHG